MNDTWNVRVWPGAVIVALMLAGMIIPGQVVPQTMVHFVSMFGGPAMAALAVIIWWTTLARVGGGRPRWLYPAVLIVPAVGLGMTLFRTTIPAILLYAIPLVLLAWIGWLTITPWLTAGARQTGLAVVMLAAWTLVACVRFEGLEGDFVPNLAWRWTPRQEDRFLAERVAPAKRPDAGTSQIAIAPGDWPEFRGSGRAARVAGVRIDPDWNARPPKLIWKKRVGPGWSSFAAVGDRLYTQEQRADDEAVVCYSAATGEELWEYRSPGRFEEAVSGAGPRATPTVDSNGLLYALGAAGRLVCLKPMTGDLVWQVDLVKDHGGTVPQWGYASSPLVVQGRVITYVGGSTNRGMAAFDAATGQHLWSAGQASHSYSSPQWATLAGVGQALQSSEHGLEAFDPADGKLLWEHPWTIVGMNRVTQPAVVGETDVLIGTGVGPEQGTRRLKVSRSGERWMVEPVWTSRAMKAYFNDAVQYRGHLYGFDTSRFVCVDVANGKLKWKDGGRNGNGQCLLLEDQGLLLILAADGTLALAEANPAEPRELARVPALEGKTWNHLVYHRGRLYLRNAQEAACFELATIPN